SKLRKGVPPQLERIIMHALAKVPGERYQSAGDFATDLERFLHTYSPVFTAGKISQLIKQVIGEPMQVPDEQKFPSVEFRDGLNSTHALSDADLAGAADRDNLRDENSVIFRVAELKPPPLDETAPMKKQPAAAQAMQAASSRALKKTEPPKIPSIFPPARKPPTPAKPLPVRAPLKPRKAHEETRQLIGAAPPDPDDDGSGLLTVEGKKHLPRAWDSTDTDPGRTDLPDDLENIGERTLITAMPGAASGLGFMMDAGDDAIDATMVSHGPPIADPDTDQHASAEEDALEPDDGLGDPFDPDGDEDGPTLAREFVPATRPTARNRAQPPPALAAKIHAPAVSSLRQPKASRRTPPGGSPQANVLQQIVNSRASEPMPVPAPPRHHEPPPPQFPMATPGGQPAMNYNTDASGMPLGLHTPPSGMPVSHQPYVHMQGVPPGYPQYQQGHPGYPVQPQYPQVDSMQMAQTSPQALYGMSHHPVQPMTLTGQMRLFEVDEIPAQYKLGAARRRWFTYIVAGMLAISVAAIATFLIIRATRENPSKTAGVIVVESVPAGAEVYYDNQRLAGTTPMTIDEVPLGTRHDIRVELPKHKPYLETVDVSKAIGEAKVSATLKIVTGKLVINSRPGGAEIRINGEVRGRTPGKIEDLDMGAAKKLELRLKDYQPYIEDLKWPADGEIQLDIPLQR
ncbi:MAG: PEGA domain-containing protein, partial [Kofleriaceae bacterium]